MTTEIQIINGVARLTETRVIGEMPLSELAPYLEYRKPVTLPVLPNDVTFVTYDEQNTRGVMLVERPPTVTGLSCHFDAGNRFPAEDRAQVNNPESDWRTFVVSLPWQYHLFGFTIINRAQATFNQTFRIDETGYFWSKTQMQSLDHEIVAAALLNINTSAAICWGSTQAPTDTLKNRVNSQVKNFLGTHFNTHFGWFKPPAYNSYTQWEAASKADPNCWAGPEWDSYWDAKTKAGAKYRRTSPLQLAEPFDPEAPRTPTVAISTWGVPNPPPVFTVAKAIEWFDRMDEDDRRRFTYALTEAAKQTPPAIEEAPTPGMARVNA